MARNNQENNNIQISTIYICLLITSNTFESSPISLVSFSPPGDENGLGLLFSFSGIHTDCERSNATPPLGVEGRSWELELKGSGGRFLARFVTSGEGSGSGLLLWRIAEDSQSLHPQVLTNSLSLTPVQIPEEVIF